MTPMGYVSYDKNIVAFGDFACDHRCNDYCRGTPRYVFSKCVANEPH